MPAALLSAEDQEVIIRRLDEYKSAYAKQQDEIARLGKANSETLEKINKLDDAAIEMRGKYDAAAKRADDLEVKMNQRKAELEPPKSIGQEFIDDPGLIAHAKAGSRNPYMVNMKRAMWAQKAITGLSPLLPERITEIAVAARLPIGVRSLVPQGTTTAGAVSYVQETSFTNNANVVAEGAAKPVSDKTFNAIVVPVETIAHLFKVSRQSWEDLPALQAQIDSNGTYGVKLKEDQQLLFGTGISPQLKGFMTVATAAPVPGTAAAGFNLLDAVGAAIFDLAAKGWMADGVVMNAADWGALALKKNTQGNYLFSNPLEYSEAGQVWGVRRVFSSQMTAGNFLAGAFRGNSLILDREEVNVQVAEQNVDDFEKNMLTVRVEERLVLLIFRPEAFEKGVTPVAALEGGGGPENEAQGRRR